MKRIVKSEPVRIGGLVTAIMAFLAMGVSLGWFSLTEEQIQDIQRFLVAALPVAVYLVAEGVRMFTRPAGDE